MQGYAGRPVELRTDAELYNGLRDIEDAIRAMPLGPNVERYVREGRAIEREQLNRQRRRFTRRQLRAVELPDELSLPLDQRRFYRAAKWGARYGASRSAMTPWKTRARQLLWNAQFEHGWYQRHKKEERRAR